MKISLFVAALFFGIFSPNPNPAEPGKNGKLTVQVETPANESGDLHVLLFNRFDYNYLPKDAAFIKVEKPGNQGDQIITYSSIPYGDYIVLTYLDQNGNGKLDRNFFGNPKEPWGISSGNGETVNSSTYTHAAVFNFNQNDQLVNVAINHNVKVGTEQEENENTEGPDYSVNE